MLTPLLLLGKSVAFGGPRAILADSGTILSLRLAQQKRSSSSQALADGPELSATDENFLTNMLARAANSSRELLPGLESMSAPHSWLKAAALSLEPPNSEDIAVIEQRHLEHKATGLLGVGRRCKHGFPQAFAWDPFRQYHKKSNSTLAPLDSGLFRLCCAILVEAIDVWEAQGAVRELNAEVTANKHKTSVAARLIQRRANHLSSPPTSPHIPSTLAAALNAAHAGHSVARLVLSGEARLRRLLEQEKSNTEYGKHIRTILQSGIAGQVRSKVDVKCLHAQVADHLCRSGDNLVGASILQRLEARGIDIHGNEACLNQCNMCQTRDAAKASGWYYNPSKNRWKLRKRQILRAANRQARFLDTKAME